jgi:hypothetical protein
MTTFMPTRQIGIPTPIVITTTMRTSITAAMRVRLTVLKWTIGLRPFATLTLHRGQRCCDKSATACESAARSVWNAGPTRRGRVSSSTQGERRKGHRAPLASGLPASLTKLCISEFWVIALRPRTPKHIRGGWSHYTDTSELVDGNGAQSMITV